MGLDGGGSTETGGGGGRGGGGWGWHPFCDPEFGTHTGPKQLKNLCSLKGDRKVYMGRPQFSFNNWKEFSFDLQMFFFSFFKQTGFQSETSNNLNYKITHSWLGGGTTFNT